MFVTLVHIHVKPDQVDTFLDATRANHEASIREDGNLRFDVLALGRGPAPVRPLRVVRGRGRGAPPPGHAALRRLARRDGGRVRGAALRRPLRRPVPGDAHRLARDQSGRRATASRLEPIGTRQPRPANATSGASRARRAPSSRRFVATYSPRRDAATPPLRMPTRSARVRSRRIGAGRNQYRCVRYSISRPDASRTRPRERTPYRR